jgi:large subunit ribosomal protein L9
MEVILLEAVDGLGRRGDKISVTRGFARNFLLPRNLALEATSSGAALFAEMERVKKARADRDLVQAEKVAAKLNKASVTIMMQAGDDDRLFGSVTASDIAEKLTEEGFQVDKRHIHLDEPLRALGAYNVRVHLFQDVEAKVRVWVKKEGLA